MEIGLIVRQRSSSPGRGVLRGTGIFLAGGLLCAVAAAEGPSRRAEIRSETVEILAALPGESDGSLRIRIEEGGEDALPIGRRIQYQVSSDRPGYLSLLHVDAYSVVTVIHPNAVESNRLEVGKEMALPPIDVTPPIGKEEIFLIVSDEAVTLEALGLIAGRHGFAVGGHGIAPDRLIVRAYGESDPLEPDTSEDARRINRRVEFSLGQ